MKKQIWLPALAWVGGIVGFFLRRWELNTAYDPGTRLMSMTAAGVLLTVLMALAAVGFIPGCRKMGCRTGKDWFYAPNSGYAMVATAGALVMLLGGGFGVRALYATGQRNAMGLVAGILLIVGGAMAAVATRDIYRGRWSQAVSILLMGPAFAAVFWLVCVYQQHAAQPVVQMYVWQVLSAVAILLALYGQTSLSLDRGNAGRTCAFGLIAIAMTPVALADGVGFEHSLVWLGSALWLTAQSYTLLGAAFGPERPERMCPTEDEEQTDEETDTDLEDTENGQ